jgi:hypothetical protein
MCLNIQQKKMKGQKSIVKNDDWFFEYDKQIKNTALFLFGIYKTLISELPPREY